MFLDVFRMWSMCEPTQVRGQPKNGFYFDIDVTGAFDHLRQGGFADRIGVAQVLRDPYRAHAELLGALEVYERVLDEDAAADFLRRQVLTSRNLTGGRVVAIAFGGLNYQIEHHLFPSMPSRNLRRCRPIVMEFCASPIRRADV